MTARAESTKLNELLLKLPDALGDVSKGCQIIGYRSDTFYEVRRTQMMEPPVSSGRSGGSFDCCLIFISEMARENQRRHIEQMRITVEAYLFDYALDMCAASG